MESPQHRPRSIRRELAVAVAMPLLIFVVLAAGLARQVRVLLKDAESVEHTDVVLATGNALQTEILNMQTGVRGFLLTQDAAFLTPFNRGARALGSGIDQLRTMTSDNLPQTIRLSALQSVVSQWEQRARTMLQADASELPSLLRESERQMDEIRVIMGGFLQTETALQHQREVQVDRTKRQTALFGGLSVLLAAIMVAFVTQRQLLSVSHEYDRALGVERRAVQLRDVFLTVASHELRTPLTSLKLQVERLVRLVPNHCDSPKVLMSIEVIQRQMGRMEKLVAQLLDVSQLSSGPLALEWTSVDLSALLRECVAEIKDEARLSGHELVIDAPVSLKGETDPVRFRQIVTNLVSNALKFGEKKPIRVTLTSLEDRVQLTVEDQGVGISRADQERIFQQFEQAVSSMSYGGFGIGLWLVRAFAQAMGGTVAVRSARGEGATFTVDLPRQHVEEKLERAKSPGRARASDPVAHL